MLMRNTTALIAPHNFSGVRRTSTCMCLGLLGFKKNETSCWREDTKTWQCGRETHGMWRDSVIMKKWQCNVWYHVSFFNVFLDYFVSDTILPCNSIILHFLRLILMALLCNCLNLSPPLGSELLSTNQPKSYHLDYISTAIIKQLSFVVSELIAYLPNLSNSQGSFPSNFCNPTWKTSYWSNCVCKFHISNVNNISKTISFYMFSIPYTLSFHLILILCTSLSQTSSYWSSSYSPYSYRSIT